MGELTPCAISHQGLHKRVNPSLCPADFRLLFFFTSPQLGCRVPRDRFTRLARCVAGEAAPPARVRVLLASEARPIRHPDRSERTLATRKDLGQLRRPRSRYRFLVAKRPPSYLARYFMERRPTATAVGGEGSGSPAPEGSREIIFSCSLPSVVPEGQPTESSQLGSPAEKIFREDKLCDAGGLPRLPVDFLIADHRRGIQIDAV